jgi:hypothetical protein
MKKISKKGLSLSRETVRHLQNGDLASAVGAARPNGPTHSCAAACPVTERWACSFDGGCTGIITWDGNC